jgi:putative ABC transport system permease protein
MSDTRFAIRQLVKRPAFTATAVATLAIGIGATTTIFSVVDHLMLKDLPFADADRIVTVWQDNQRLGIAREDVAPANFFDWRDRNTVFAAIGGTEPYSQDLTGEGRPEVILSSLVTEGYFEALGIRPIRGRVFGPDDFGTVTEGPSGNVAVLGYGLWQQRFGGAEDIIGRTLILDGQPVVVVGILPPDVDLGLSYSVRKRELWLPKVIQPWEQYLRSSAGWTVVARLKPGVTVAQAEAEMDRIAANLATEHPETNERVGTTVVPLREQLVGAARPTLLLLLGAVGLVLVIACANVAHLQLARGTERVGEFAVRAALGADRGRIVRQLLTESLLLALVGAGLGGALAFWGVDVVRAISPGEIPRLDSVAVDTRVLGFALGLGALSAIGFGLAPAFQFSRPGLQEGLKEGRLTASLARQRVRRGLIVGEMAIALTLLIGAGLLIRSFAAILAVDPGLRTDDVLAMQIFYYHDDQDAQDRITFFERTLEDIEALPGVQSAGAVSAAPFLAANIDIRRPFRILDQPAPREGEEPFLYRTMATPRYFETVGIPVIEGRGFTAFDRLDAPRVAVINETLRRRYWPNESPIGKRIALQTTQSAPTAQPPIEIVGVVGDVRHTGLDSEPRPEAFFPHAQSGTGSMTYYVRAGGNPRDLVNPVQEVIWSAEPMQSIHQAGTLNQLVSGTLVARRFTLVLLSVFAGIALLMAAVGTYGVMSFTVNQRTHEVGIRMALGADRESVVRMIVRQGFELAALGMITGLAIAFFGTQVMSRLLYGIPPRDVVAFGGAVVVLTLAALLACWVPARRATRVAPMEALRHE